MNLEVRRSFWELNYMVNTQWMRSTIIKVCSVRHSTTGSLLLGPSRYWHLKKECVCQKGLVLMVMGIERRRWARTTKIEGEVTERPVLGRAQLGFREACTPAWGLSLFSLGPGICLLHGHLELSGPDALGCLNPPVDLSDSDSVSMSRYMLTCPWPFWSSLNLNNLHFGLPKNIWIRLLWLCPQAVTPLFMCWQNQMMHLGTVIPDYN